MRTIQLLIFLCCAIANGCKNSKNQMLVDGQASVKNSNTLAKNTQIQFAMSSTSCFGECPVFDFEFRSDSMVLLNSKQYLLPNGSYQYKLTDSDYNKLTRLIRSVKWQTLEESYSTNTKDLPTNEFEVKLESGTKKVKQEGATPQSLLIFKESMLKLIQSFDWQSK